MRSHAVRVLLVDDAFSNVKMLEAKLENEGFAVQIACDGTEALAKIDKDRFHIVLLDVMMPGLDGFEVCRRIKRRHETEALPVILITALDSSADRQTGLDAGADDFFVKPVEDQLLFGRVFELVGGKAPGEPPLAAAGGESS